MVSGGDVGITVAAFAGNAADSRGDLTNNTVSGATVAGIQLTADNDQDSVRPLATIRSTTVTYSGGPGIDIQAGEALIEESTIDGNGTGVLISNAAKADLGDVEGPGGTTTLGTSLGCNHIHANPAGVVNLTGFTIKAENNWWGAASGPSGAGSGNGDSVSTGVDFTPFFQDPFGLPSLVAGVQSLMAQGVLNQGQGRQLIRDLEAAMESSANGNLVAANAEFQDFQQQVVVLQNRGVLDSTHVLFLARLGCLLFQVQSLDFVTGEGTLGDLSEDNPPGFQGGYRFFPDAANAQTNKVERNIVRVRAVLAQAAVNVPVYFRSFDVDDPSTDAVIDSNGARGLDNRDDDLGKQPKNGYSGRLRSVHGKFAGDGEIVTVRTVIDDVTGQAIAEVELATSFQPGDNFRVVASTSLLFVAALDSALGVPTSGPVPNFHGVATQQLSVWRRLHLEVDSMGRVAGNIVSGKIVAVDPDPANNVIRVTTDLRMFDSSNRFENGVLANNNVGFKVLGNFANGTVFTLAPRADGRLPVVGDFSVFDDDVYREGQDLPMPAPNAFTALDDALAQAYVQVETTLDDTNLQFHVYGAPRNHWDWDSEKDNTDIYWVGYLLAAFQTRDVNSKFDQTPRDGDPDSERRVITGDTDPFKGGSVIYLESIQDVARTRGRNPLFEEVDTVVHELGHAVGRSQVEPVTLFPASFRYTPFYINAIRSSDGPASS